MMSKLFVLSTKLPRILMQKLSFENIRTDVPITTYCNKKDTVYNRLHALKTQWQVIFDLSLRKFISGVPT